MNSDQLISGLLKQEKGPQLEFKSSANPEIIGRILCSFLNNDGGQLLLGVSDDKQVIGIAHAEKLMTELNIYLTQEIIPETPIMISKEIYQGKELLLLKVWAGSKPPYIFQGGIFFRQGDSTKRASSIELSKLIHNRQLIDTHWERQLAFGVDLEDLDLDQLKMTIHETNNKEKDATFREDPISFLTYFGLYQNEAFTNAAVVLFCKNPARFLPQTRIRTALLKKGKTGDEFVDDNILDGNLFSNIEKIQGFLEKHLSTSRRFSNDSWTHNDDYIYPLAALREGIINALVHRDYSSISGSISILIYPDRLEIINSGNSPLQSAQFKKNHLSIPVNPDIAHITYLRGYMEKIGRGTLKILEACKQAHLPEPEWDTAHDAVKLSFFNNAATDESSDSSIESPKVVTEGTVEGTVEGTIEGTIEGTTTAVRNKLAQVLKAIIKDEGKRVPEYKEVTSFSDSTMERYLKMLRKADLIKFKGDSLQTGGYFITDKLKKLLKK